MRLRDHVILGGSASAALAPVLGADLLIFFCASVLIDVDHYIDYVWHNAFRDLSPSGMFAYHRVLEGMWPRKEFLSLEVFHTVEFLAALYAASWLLASGALRAVFWGMVFHVLLDIVFLFRHRALFKRSYSVTEHLVRTAVMRSRGLRPSEVFAEAVEMTMGDKANARVEPIKPVDAR